MANCNNCGSEIEDIVYEMNQSVMRGPQGTFVVTASCAHCGQDFDIGQVIISIKLGTIVVHKIAIARAS